MTRPEQIKMMKECIGDAGIVLGEPNDFCFLEQYTPMLSDTAIAFFQYRCEQTLMEEYRIRMHGVNDGIQIG